MSTATLAQNKFVTFLKKRDPKLSDKDINELLSGFKRFVKVVHKIYTEPQAQFHIEDKYKKYKVKGGEIVVEKAEKVKIISADYEELKKVFDKSKKKQNLIEVLRQFTKEVTKDKYGR